MNRYQVLFSEKGRLDITELRISSARMLLSWITEYLEECNNPRIRGRGLTGEVDCWRYKVGRYRILAQIQENKIIVFAVTGTSNVDKEHENRKNEKG